MIGSAGAVGSRAGTGLDPVAHRSELRAPRRGIRARASPAASSLARVLPRARGRNAQVLPLPRVLLAQRKRGRGRGVAPRGRGPPTPAGRPTHACMPCRCRSAGSRRTRGSRAWRSSGSSPHLPDTAPSRNPGPAPARARDRRRRPARRGRHDSTPRHAFDPRGRSAAGCACAAARAGCRRASALPPPPAVRVSPSSSRSVSRLPAGGCEHPSPRTDPVAPIALAPTKAPARASEGGRQAGSNSRRKDHLARRSVSSPAPAGKCSS